MKQNSVCLNCSSSFIFNPYHQKGKYCNNKCQQEHVRNQYISEWKQGLVSGGKSYNLSQYVRNYLLEESQHMCSKCSWSETNIHTGKVPLEIDHIDDNPFNHSPDNLQVLCPNCHSLKTQPPCKSKGGRYKNGNHPKFRVIGAEVAQ